MGKIILDQYLINLGLTEEIFCNAYKFSVDELEDNTLALKVIQRKNVKSAKKTKQIWELKLFVNNASKGIDLCMRGKNEEIVQKAVEQMKMEASSPSPSGVKTKIQGTGPKEMPFVKWLDRQINDIEIQALVASERRKQGAEKKAEQEKNLVPLSLKAIKVLQYMIEKDNLVQETYDLFLERSALLMAHDPAVFTQIKYEIETLIEFSKVDFNRIVCAATQKNRDISLLDSKGELIIKVRCKGGHIVNIRQYKAFSGTINYSLSITHGRLKKQIITLTDRAHDAIRVEQLNTLLHATSNTLDLAIKDIQKAFSKKLDKLYLLEQHDATGFSYDIVKNYGKKDLIFNDVDDKITTSEALEETLWAWIEEIKQYLSQPSVLTEAIITVLELVNASPNYGVRTYAMWLGSSKAKALSGKDLDNTFRHRLKHYAIDRIAQQINDIIHDYGWLQVKYIGYYDNPVLYLSQTGQNILACYHDTHAPSNESSLDKDKIRKEKKQHANNEKDKGETPECVELYPYTILIEQIENKDKSAWIDFLDSAQNVTQVAGWNQTQIKNLSKRLNQNMDGWKALAKWKLLKHPIKYKNLERLL